MTNVQLTVYSKLCQDYHYNRTPRRRKGQESVVSGIHTCLEAPATRSLHVTTSQLRPKGALTSEDILEP